MKKVEALKVKYEAAQDGKAQLEDDIRSLKQRQSDLEAQAERKAQAGDLDGYLEIKAIADRAGAELHVREIQLRKADDPVTLEEAIDAWKEYVKPVDAEFRKKYADYKKSRTALADKFRELMRCQEEAFFTRETLAQYCGQKMDGMDLNDDLSSFPMDTVGMNEVSHDRTFFLRTGETRPEEDQHYGTLVFSHRSH